MCIVVTDIGGEERSNRWEIIVFILSLQRVGFSTYSFGDLDHRI